MPRDVKQYVKMRNEKLQGPLEEFVKWAAPLTNRGGQKDYKILEITYHKMRTACIGLPMELRSQSKRWLLDRNMTPHDDGDVPI